MKQLLKTITVFTVTIAMLMNCTYAAKKKGLTKAKESPKQVSLYSKSTSVSNGEIVSAFYNRDGSLIGTSRNISFDQLGNDVKNKIKSQYLQNGYSIAESIEFTNDDESAFYLKLVLDNKTVMLKVSDGKYVSEFKG